MMIRTQLHNHRRALLSIALALAMALSVSACSEQRPSEVTYSYGTAAKTPKNSSVSTLVASRQLTTQEKSDIDNWVKNNYKNAVKVSDASSKYNCHSYAWYSQSTSNGYWINDPSKYWTDGSYSLKASQTASNTIPSAAKNGYKVRYYSSSEGNMHSAIVYSSTQFISKWGPAGVYRHKPKETPYSPSTFYYYTR